MIEPVCLTASQLYNSKCRGKAVSVMTSFTKISVEICPSGYPSMICLREKCQNFSFGNVTLPRHLLLKNPHFNYLLMSVKKGHFQFQQFNVPRNCHWYVGIIPCNFSWTLTSWQGVIYIFSPEYLKIYLWMYAFFSFFKKILLETQNAEEKVNWREGERDRDWKEGRETGSSSFYWLFPQVPITAGAVRSRSSQDLIWVAVIPNGGLPHCSTVPTW